jgi:hypothetical protein
MGDHNKQTDTCPRCKHEEILDHGLCVHCYPTDVITLAGLLEQAEYRFGARFDASVRRHRRAYILDKTKALRAKLKQAKLKSHWAEKPSKKRK